jgi:hypothetical protein
MDIASITLILADLVRMGQQDFSLTDKELQVLRLLQTLEGQRFHIEQLTEGTELVPDQAEKALLSLQKHGLVKISVTERKMSEPEKLSLENSLLTVEEMLRRFSRLAAKKESTKATVFDRVTEKLNEELSKAVAGLEFAVDRTVDQLSQLTNEIGELKDRIDEVALLVEIEGMSAEDADMETQRCRNELARLEAQKRGILEPESRAQEPNAPTRKQREKEAHRLNVLIEELEVRKRVGEFNGKEGEFNAKRDELLASLTTLSGQHAQGDLLVGRARDVNRAGRNLADSKLLLEQTFNRLARACDRITEMNSTEKAEQGK